MTRPLVLPDHNLLQEVYAVLPVTEAAPVDDLAWIVYERFDYAADGGDILPSELEGAVADRLRRLRAKGRAEKIGDGWKRSGAPGPART